MFIQSDGIRIIREKLGYSQTEFANELLIPQPYLSAMESGKKSITLKMCIQLRDKFNVSVDWLLTGEGDVYVNNKTKSILPNIENEESDSSILYFPSQPSIICLPALTKKIKKVTIDFGDS